MMTAHRSASEARKKFDLTRSESDKEDAVEAQKEGFSAFYIGCYLENGFAMRGSLREEELDDPEKVFSVLKEMRLAIQHGLSKEQGNN